MSAGLKGDNADAAIRTKGIAPRDPIFDEVTLPFGTQFDGNRRKWQPSGWNPSLENIPSFLDNRVADLNKWREEVIVAKKNGEGAAPSWRA